MKWVYDNKGNMVYRVITQKQWQNWGNPCTPDTFKRWNNKWYGLVNR